MLYSKYFDRSYQFGMNINAQKHQIAWASPPGGMGVVSPRFDILGDVPQNSWLKKYEFLAKIYLFSHISKIKWAKSQEKSDLGVGGFDSSEYVPPVETSWRRPCQIAPTSSSASA